LIREEVLNLYHVLTDDERNKLRELLERFSVIIRIANCTDLINDLDELEGFCLETYVKLLELFPWASVPNSVHKALAHLAQVIAANGGFGLGQLSGMTYLKVFSLFFTHMYIQIFF
jgi:hypothetical protein